MRKVEPRRPESARLSDDLEQAIRSGRLMPGDRLPGEESLCRDYGVSRPVVREAIQSLRARGLVVSRRGSGSYVSENAGAVSLRKSMEFYSALRQRGKAFRELMALRQMIECACVVELARPGRQAARESLREALQTMVHCRKDLDAFGRADIAFHILLVDAAENDLFSTIMGGLMPGLGVQYALETYVEAGIVDKILREHESICEALDAGRGPRARTALRHHLMASAAHFERLLGDVQL